jgi:spermidine synthase
MTQPWQTLDQVETDEGSLELRCRGDREYLITIAGRILMNSFADRSERLLAEWACADMGAKKEPRIAIGGLGMGCTLRAALDCLPGDAHVTVVELTPIVKEWCAGPLSGVNGAALSDPRVEVVIGDVADIIRQVAEDAARPRFDAILLDLYEGPHAGTNASRDPFYGSQAIDATRRALSPDGTFAVWSEGPDEGFRKRVKKVGFSVENKLAGRGGKRHAVTLARRKR